MGIRTQNIEHGAIADQLLGGASNDSGFGEFPTTPLTFKPPSSKRTHVYELFNTFPEASNFRLAAGGGGTGGIAATGAAGDVNLVRSRFTTFQYHVLGTQTLLSPKVVATGWDISQDQTDNDGVEYTLGCETSAGSAVITNGNFIYTVGTSDAFFFRLKFTIADVSGTDDCCVGFRKNEIYQANVDDYDEAAFLNVILGDINIETILNNGATTTTDTTNNWTDGQTKTLQVNVSSAGAVTYKIDGAAPIVTAAFSFDSGEVVIPFFYFLQATTSPGVVTLHEWECGFQSASGD